MNNAGKLSLDMFLMFLRYTIVAYCVHKGIVGDMQDALINMSIAGATLMWASCASGHWHRFTDWFKSLSKDV